jgi:hypothetical protein
VWSLYHDSSIPFSQELFIDDDDNDGIGNTKLLRFHEKKKKKIMMELGTYLDKLAATIVHFSNLPAFTYIACSMLCTNKVMLLYFHDF